MKRFASLLCGLFLISVFAGHSAALAKVRIYGGPVPSAGSGRYYPPGGNLRGSEDTLWISGDSPGVRRQREPRLDLNPRFVPGTPFTLPGYVPRFFPRSLYFAGDFIGRYSETSSLRGQLLPGTPAS